MKKMMKKTLAFVLTLAMCFAFVPSAMAAEEDEQETNPQGTSVVDPDVKGAKSASPTELTKNNRETTVTLSLPSAEHQKEYDVVFVMDSSTSTANSNVDFSESVSTLMEHLTEKEARINVGVIKFRGLAFDAIDLVSEDLSGLVEYNDDTKDVITAAINFKEADLKKLSSGTNLHGGLDMANDWLKKSSLPDDHKYVIALTDGKTYIWNDEDDVATSVYGQYMARNVVYNTPAVGQQTIAYSKSAYKFKDGINFFDISNEEAQSMSFDERFERTKNFYTEDFYKLYYSTNQELSEPTKYDYRCGYAYKEGSTAKGTAGEFNVTNGNKYTYNLHKKYYPFTLDASMADLNWLQANPYRVVQNEDETYSYTEEVNPDFYQLHPDGLQKALYLSAHLWSDMVEQYNCATIVYKDWDGGSGLETAKSFCDWMLDKENSDFTANMGNETEVQKMFNTIEADILYMVNSGTVTDVIPDTFTLVENGTDTFKLTLDGQPLTATADGENAWDFQLPTEGEEQDETSEEAPYRVEYDKDNQTIKWIINVPVENLKQVKLSYDLRIGEQAVSGQSYYTNTSAELAYTTSENTTGTYVFEKPQVTYTELYHITYDANGGTGTVQDTADYTKGSDVTLRPNNFTRSGYTFSGWSTDANGSAQYQPGDTFENLTEDTTFYAIWKQNSGGGTDIDDEDVPLDLNGEDHFAYIEGYPDGTVQPEGNITRAEVATMIYRLLTEERRAEIFTNQNDYSDVEMKNWFNKAVSSMTAGKYVNGYPNGSFLPNQKITRAEFVTIVVRFLEGERDAENPFSDINGHWAQKYILSAVNAGWIDGYPDGTFRPQEPIKRDEAMKIMNTILHRGINKESELGTPVMFPDNADPSKWYYYEVIEATNDHETEGERPDEDWTKNECEYVYDIVKYERP